MEWLKKLGAAIDYIEDNLDKEISYDEAARIACCSPYNFQRIFSYVSGVSLSEYIRRRKMTQAAFELQRIDSKVIEIVPDFWKAALQGNQFSGICKLSNQKPDGILGISIYEGPKEIYYYIGVATNVSAPAGMYEYEIPAATWAIFENNGRFKEDVQSIFRRFYMEWLPFSGYKYAELPDIEVYPICDSQPVHEHSEVWIAIKKEDR